MGPLLLKTDSYGNIEWNQIYEGQYSDAAYSLIETSDGGYALISSDTQQIKFDTYGNMEWNRTLLGGYRAYSFIQTIDGGYVVTGSSGDVGHGEEPYFWLVNTDELGYNLQNKTYETVMTGSAASVIQTIDGGFAMLGCNSFNPDFLLVKTDSNGNMLWMKNYPSISSLEMASTSDDGYILCSNLTLLTIF